MNLCMGSYHCSSTTLDSRAQHRNAPPPCMLSAARDPAPQSALLLQTLNACEHHIMVCLLSPTEQVLQPLVSGILLVTAHFLNTDHKVFNWREHILRSRQKVTSSGVTLVTVCASARGPSSDPSGPGRTAPSECVSGAVRIYLKTFKYNPN